MPVSASLILWVFAVCLSKTHCGPQHLLVIWKAPTVVSATDYADICISDSQLWLHQELLGTDRYLHLCDHHTVAYWRQEGASRHVQLCPWDDQRQQVRKRGTVQPVLAKRHAVKCDWTVSIYSPLLFKDCSADKGWVSVCGKTLLIINFTTHFLIR